LAYLMIYFVRSVGFVFRAIQGYVTMKQHLKLDWIAFNEDIELGKVTSREVQRPRWHLDNIKRNLSYKKSYKPSDIVHVAMIATVNESREILELTIQSIIDSDYDSKKIILVFAYEGRAGKETQDRINQLVNNYSSKFMDAMAFQHPANIAGEQIGKGGNISFAGRQLKIYLEKKNIAPKNVLVTTLDADNRPNKKYFSGLTYLFCIVPNPLRASFQPLPMFTNNIWDVPTMMRVIATSNNLFYIVLSKRPHLQRNFSAHAQSMQSLIETNFWSTRTVVEDGHHFWRSYFRYDGDYRVYPISIPIYQDAVLADGYVRTLRAQFIQLRRWTYGASDVAYIADKGFFHKNNASKYDVLIKLLRTLEGHVTWATGTVLVFGAAFIPSFFHPQSFAANELPQIVSKIQQLGIIGLLVSVYVCLVTLPPRPSRYKRHRSVLMILQWALAPFISIVYGSLAAFNSQTRLMFKRYLSKFDVTEHAMVTTSGKMVSSEADPDNPR
jgi:cellulose synthase/poly-beta-1,6-N-acetylglucosamine synthase-like glycosyltransferase